MASPLTQSFGQIRLNGAIETTVNGNRTVVGLGTGMITTDSGALISYTNSVSGILAAQIAGSAGGVSQINGLSGTLTFIGTGNFPTQINNITILTGAGGKIYVSGSGLAQAVDLTQSGIAILSQISSLSGFITSNYATIANLQSTGQTLYNDIINWSGIQQDFATLIPTGSGALTIVYPLPFTSTPSSVECSMIIFSGNGFGYGTYPSQVSSTQYICLFTDFCLESGNYISTRVHL